MRQILHNIMNDVAKNEEVINSFKYSDSQNARITSDKIVAQEMLKYITTNFDLYKRFSDNQEFKEEFALLMFDGVKELIGQRHSKSI